MSDAPAACHHLCPLVLTLASYYYQSKLRLCNQVIPTRPDSINSTGVSPPFHSFSPSFPPFHPFSPHFTHLAPVSPHFTHLARPFPLDLFFGVGAGGASNLPRFLPERRLPFKIKSVKAYWVFNLTCMEVSFTPRSAVDALDLEDVSRKSQLQSTTYGCSSSGSGSPSTSGS